MIELGNTYTVGGLVMRLFLSACAAAGGTDAEGPTPSVRDSLAPDSVPFFSYSSDWYDDDLPIAG